MSPVQIWVLALRRKQLKAHTMDRVFNNADSFAMAFDDAWKASNRKPSEQDLSVDERVKAIFTDYISDHPFLLSEPEQAKKVADFRIRLLDLG
ncbi:hypothetical protein [Synechococcus sp. MIT S9451]|uniref:hypothetical protein n=1 Tax=Synechococcus sp. MIT S9451 TaxID=3082543 RepID=UPI0039B55699